MATSTEPARRRRSPPSPARSEPRQRDADRSQQAILAAARDEFHEHGLGGARVERIAERAAVDKKLIYYYFENKDRLFQAVLEEAYRGIR
ncbi:MAG: helix-turn-helix transcriptional regulator, partial [Rubrivivax sp.]|nr:helix-turn-helix transcriptional regulator [Rubrivivax sp.]